MEQQLNDVLSLRDVRKVFRTDIRKKPQVALESLTLAFRRATCTGLLGHNGAGKTTTIRMILGLVRPDKGEILFEGHPLTIEAKRHIGYMPEVNKLPAALKVDEILHNHLMLFRPAGVRTGAERKCAIDELLERVGLAAHRSKRIGKLSKGMARRVAWAQAIIHKPRLLILDEPSSGLDPLGRREMLTWISEEKTRGTSIVLCTHELIQVHSLCDQFHILNRGKLVYSTMSGDGSARGETQQWLLQVSGASDVELRRHGETARLQPWSEISHDGFLATLSFTSYGNAAAWTKHLLEEGLVVVRFGDQMSLGEEALLPYFKGVD